jgi:cobalt/nickel transport system permease protein
VSAAPAIVASLLDFRRLDQLAVADTAVHRIDARAKVITTLVFIVCVMSFERHAVAALWPYLLFPVALVARARLPTGYVLRKVALVLPIAAAIALPNVWFERDTLVHVGSASFSAGWSSALSIILRSALAASAAIVLVAVTGLPALGHAMERLGVPHALAVQLQFLHRYLVVLGEEALRMVTAQEQRNAGRPLTLRMYGALTGRLLLRTWDRAERIYLAMLARGYDGRLGRVERRPFGARDWAFMLGWSALFVLLRTVDVADWLGSLALGSAP